jgi:hypothetical protein
MSKTNSQSTSTYISLWPSVLISVSPCNPVKNSQTFFVYYHNNFKFELKVQTENVGDIYTNTMQKKERLKKRKRAVLVI